MPSIYAPDAHQSGIWTRGVRIQGTRAWCAPPALVVSTARSCMTTRSSFAAFYLRRHAPRAPLGPIPVVRRALLTGEIAFITRTHIHVLSTRNLASYCSACALPGDSLRRCTTCKVAHYCDAVRLPHSSFNFPLLMLPLYRIARIATGLCTRKNVPRL